MIYFSFPNGREHNSDKFEVHKKFFITINKASVTF